MLTLCFFQRDDMPAQARPGAPGGGFGPRGAGGAPGAPPTGAAPALSGIPSGTM